MFRVRASGSSFRFGCCQPSAIPKPFSRKFGFGAVPPAIFFSGLGFTNQCVLQDHLLGLGKLQDLHLGFGSPFNVQDVPIVNFHRFGFGALPLAIFFSSSGCTKHMSSLRFSKQHVVVRGFCRAGSSFRVLNFLLFVLVFGVWQQTSPSNVWGLPIDIIFSFWALPAIHDLLRLGFSNL